MKLTYEVKMAYEWDRKKAYLETFTITAESSFTALKLIKRAICPDMLISIKLIKEAK